MRFLVAMPRRIYRNTINDSARSRNRCTSIGMNDLTKYRVSDKSTRVGAGKGPARKRNKPSVPAPATITPATMDQVISKHRNKPGELLGILEELQNLHPNKFLPTETLEYVAEEIGLPVSQVYSVATFYAFFNLKPQGKHTLVVCRGTACHTRGSKALFEALKKHLNLKEEDDTEKIFLTTADKIFTIKTVACFGQCALAPVVEGDGKMNNHVTQVSLKELVNGLTKRGKSKK